MKNSQLKKVLITDGVHPLLIEGLESAGYVCDHHPKISLEEVRKRIPPYNGLVINSKITVDRSMLDNAPHLEFVARLGSGMEIVDQIYAAQKGVAVYSAPEGNCNAVAEHALGMLLALANNLVRSDQEVRQKIWRREANRGFEIMGKTVGIIGFGHTGSSFAAKLSGMGVNILAYDKYKKNYAAHLTYVEETSLKNIIQNADIISLHLPLTPETYHFINDEFIQQVAHPFLLINTSRGTCIRTQDLLEGLESGKITGACLDVFENEKTESFSENENNLYQSLYVYPQVILSPHVAGWTVESKERLAAVLLEKITNFHQ
mgnify:CR=1 FL=1